MFGSTETRQFGIHGLLTVEGAVAFERELKGTVQ